MTTTTSTSVPDHISELARLLFGAGGSLWPRAEGEARSPGIRSSGTERARRFGAGDRFCWPIRRGTYMSYTALRTQEIAESIRKTAARQKAAGFARGTGSR